MHVTRLTGGDDGSIVGSVMKPESDTMPSSSSRRGRPQGHGRPDRIAPPASLMRGERSMSAPEDPAKDLAAKPGNKTIRSPIVDPVAVAQIILERVAKGGLSKEERRSLALKFESCIEAARDGLCNDLVILTELPPERRLSLLESYGRLLEETTNVVRGALLTGKIDWAQVHALYERSETLRLQLGLSQRIQTEVWAKRMARQLVDGPTGQGAREADPARTKPPDGATGRRDDEGAKKQRERGLKDRFTFNRGQVMFDGRDLGLPTGLVIEVLKILCNRFGQTVPYGELDGGLSKNAAEEPLRGAVRKLRAALQAERIPCQIETKMREGYCLCEKSSKTQKPKQREMPRETLHTKNHK